MIGWKSFTWLYVFSTISECWHVWHSMVYYLQNYVTFYDDSLQLVHYVGNDVTDTLPRSPFFSRLFELAQNFRAIHCDVIMALNIGSTILPGLKGIHNGRKTVDMLWRKLRLFIKKIIIVMNNQLPKIRVNSAAIRETIVWLFKTFSLTVKTWISLTNILCLISSFWLKLWASVPPK